MALEKLRELRIPGTFVDLGLMRPSSLQDVGKEYDVSTTGRVGRTGSIYNLTALAVVVMVVWLARRPAWAPRALAAFLAASFLLALALDPEPWRRKLALSDIAPQLRAFSELVLCWLRDTGGFWLLTFASYVCIASSGIGPTIWTPHAFWLAYALWLGARLVYYARHRRELTGRWTRRTPPFAVHKANFRSPERAARHLAWSLWLGHVGLAFRCGRQLAVIAAFSWLAGDVPGALGHRIPHLWVLGIVGLLALFYLYGTAVGPLYYKIHRTLHASGLLYAGIHKVHHRATVPSLLDSGTESPWELALVELTGGVYLLWPSWAFVLVDLLFARSQAESHHTRSAKLAPDGHDDHVGHHFFVNFNFACSMREPEETRLKLSASGATETLLPGGVE